MLSIKEGAKLDGLKPEILLGVCICQQVFAKFGYALVITEGTGGDHMHGSKHYQGLAADLRSKDIYSDQIKLDVLCNCRLNLGLNYDMILENPKSANEHFHVEFDPK